MDQASLQDYLEDLGLPLIRFFESIDSTNDEAWRCVDIGVPHSTLIVADEQTAGRGRYQRHWVTTRGACLAFSLVLHAPPLNAQQVYLQGHREILRSSNVMETYVNTGVMKTRYRALVEDTLRINHLEEDEIGRVLQPLDTYRDEPLPRFLRFRWRIRRIETKNREARRGLHEALVRSVSTVIGVGEQP